LAGYLTLVHAFVLVTGLAGILTPGGLAVPVVLAVGVTLVLARRKATDGPAETTAPRPVAVVFAWLAVLAAGLQWAWPHVMEATRLWSWDDYTYHMVFPARWLRQHTITAPSPAQAFTMQAWYPLSASVVAAWFMAPWSGSRGDALTWVSLTGPIYVGLILAGAAALLARAGCRPGAWAAPAALLLTSPRIDIMASSFSDADLAQAAAVLGAFAFAVPREPDGPRELRADAWYAGALTGLALGVKVSAAPAALVLAGMLALRARAQPIARGRAVATVALALGGSWLATGGYWYLRNLVHTGNPVYPAAFLAWPGATFPQTTLLEYARHYGLRRALGDALVIYADWPRAHAVLAALGLAALMGWLGWHGRMLPRGARYLAGGILILAGLVLLLLPFAPYSAGNAMTFRSGFIHWDSMRYVALVPILGWIALALLLDRLSSDRRGSVAVAILVGAVLLASGMGPLLVVGLALLAWPLARRWPAPKWLATLRGRALAAAVVVPLAVAALVVRHDAKAAATAAAFTREPLYGAVVAVLDSQPAGMRVAVFGDQWIYPTFGGRDHLEPVRLDRDGRLASQPIGDAMEPGDLVVDPAAFRANLAAAGVGLVVVVHLPHPGRSAAWPTQHAALEAAGGARLLHRDAATAVWRLEP
jgi:hypothetical protein